MRAWQKGVLGAAALPAFLSYQSHQDAAESREALADAKAEQAARVADIALWDDEATCTAGLLAQGAQPAAAVNDCLSPGHAEFAVVLLFCLQDAVVDGWGGPYSGGEVEYYWDECADSSAPLDEPSYD